MTQLVPVEITLDEDRHSLIPGSLWNCLIVVNMDYKRRVVVVVIVADFMVFQELLDTVDSAIDN